MRTLMRQGAVLLLLLAATSVFPSFSRAQDSAATPRKIVLKTEPTVSALARSMHIQGIVKLEVLIAPNGSVKSMDVKGGHPLLVQSAENAVGHWKFEAAPHESKELIELKFEAQ
jgi:outer membrane biosynthesis protein TonB